MASIYTTVIDDIDEGEFIFPYHVHSIYQLISDKKDVRDGPIDTNAQNNETEFTGSLSVGSNRGSDNKTQVGKGSLSSVFGDSNLIGKEDQNSDGFSSFPSNTFVFGKNGRQSSLDDSFRVTNSDSARNEQTRSFTTQPGQIEVTQYNFDSNTDKELVQVDLEVLGIAENTDGSVYAGSIKFKLFYDVPSGDLKKSERVRKSEFGVADTNILIGVNSTGLVIEDARSFSSQQTINWVVNFSSTESYGKSN